MSETAITVEGVSKAYRIGIKEEIPDNLVAAISSWIRAPGKNFRRLRRLNTSGAAADAVVKEEEEDLIWALRDVSFEVRRGEVLGIIGRNGAGKSTLLKVLSRITEPTSGRALLNGRVSSLLEVGTGFHPELTGRENVYLNATILGMSKREVDRKFDPIVDFSGVAKFIDTPVKRYSSGMKVRLGFSVAAHLEPEILIIDEVLAVGDAEFQKKCLGKMDEVARGGRTVLFVSHNMAAVQNLCSRGVVLEGGGVVFDGEVEDAVNRYFSIAHSFEGSDLLRSNHPGVSPIAVAGMHFLDSANKEIDVPRSGDDVCLGLNLVNNSECHVAKVVVGVAFDCRKHGRVIRLSNDLIGEPIELIPVGESVVRFRVPRFPLAPGSYSITLFVSSCGDVLYWRSDAANVVVAAGDYYRSGRPPRNVSEVVFVDHFVDVLTAVSKKGKT